MLAIGVNGYGTIGKRVADAINAQPDMRIVGVTKTSPDHGASLAVDRGFPLYTPADRVDAFESNDIPISGTIDDLLAASDLVVDATPGGVGEQYLERYHEHDVPFILQGAEPDSAVETSFSAIANFDAAIGAKSARVVSCNTTGLSRTISLLDDAFGLTGARVSLIRRGGDPDQADRGPINDVLPDPVTVPSHHGPDLATVLPDITVHTMAYKVPTTLMHTHAVNLTFDTTPTPNEIRSVLDPERRITLLPADQGIRGIASIAEIGRDSGRPRGDIWETCIWDESIAVEGEDVFFTQAIHQESIVVPENIDAIRAMMKTASASESIERTDEHLGVGQWPGTDSAERVLSTANK